jgi:hypothetical protein
MKKILSDAIISAVVIALVLFATSVSVSAQEITAVRKITPAFADRGGEVDVQICFTAEEDLTTVEIAEKVPDGWDVTDMSSEPPLAALMRFNESVVEFGWGLEKIPSGTTVSATYTLHIPDNEIYARYDELYWIEVASESIPIEGDSFVLVTSGTDAYPPVIHSVNLSNKEVTPGKNIRITAEVTDDVRVKSVSANGVRLIQKGDTDVWWEYIKAEEGINVPVVVTAEDVAGETATDSSQKYNATGPAGTTPTAPSGDGGNGGDGEIPPTPPAGTPAHIALNANPADIPADGISTSTITASVWNGEEWVLGNLTVNFSTSLGNTTESAVIMNGTATAILTAGMEEGAATITAEANLSGDIGAVTNTTAVNFTTPGVTPTPAVNVTLTPAPTVMVSPTPAATVSPTPSPTKKPLIPGFEAVFAIASLLAVAHLVLRRGREA